MFPLDKSSSVFYSRQIENSAYAVFIVPEHIQHFFPLMGNFVLLFANIHQNDFPRGVQEIVTKFFFIDKLLSYFSKEFHQASMIILNN